MSLHLSDYFAFILADKIAPAERFLEVAEASFERLSENPFIGSKWDAIDPRFKDLRTYPMPERYRSYVIYYLVHPGEIEILGIIHGTLSEPSIIREFGSPGS